ncbi:permease [Anaeroselena agilis]|uniref:Permease n=1 Tax=Anaeroselena agilis TaxID=3063788 RepID=A0ABU3NU44_9FIRM|nr:permease [Selenomonadales bacterium 4137-cl]
MDILFFYGLAAVGVLWSYTKDRQKTKQSLKKAWKAFDTILPAFAVILLLIGIILAVVSPAVVTALLGANSGIYGMIIAAIVGSIALIPGFIIFPLAKTVLGMGAGIMQVAVFISTLMMVSVVTAPMEAQLFNRKVVLLRNGLSLLFSFVVAIVLGKVVG